MRLGSIALLLAVLSAALATTVEEVPAMEAVAPAAPKNAVAPMRKEEEAPAPVLMEEAKFEEKPTLNQAMPETDMLDLDATQADSPASRRILEVDIDVPGVAAEDIKITHSVGRRLLTAETIKVGHWPAVGKQAPATIPNLGYKSQPSHIPFMAHTYVTSSTAVSIQIPHDGDKTTNTQIISLHAHATDPDSFTAANNDPYTPHFHDPYSGASGTSTDDGPQGDVARYESNAVDGLTGFLSGSPTVYSTGTGQNKQPTSPSSLFRGTHDPLKISWSCTTAGGTTGAAGVAPAIAAQSSTGHAQGYRKSTGQRTQGNEVFMTDERASCSSTADVTGYKPACLPHSYDQPPATTWGAHALQDGPDITLTVPGPAFTGSGSIATTCIATFKDPYGVTTTKQIVITVAKEVNAAPTAGWGLTAGAATATVYTVPHDHSPTTNEVQVLLDGTFADADNNNNNIGPLGNTAIETTAAAQRRGFSVQEQLKWEGVWNDKDTTAWALFRGRTSPNTALTSDRTLKRQHTQKYGDDTHTFQWKCPTCTGGSAASPCIYNELKPTVSLPGPAWTRHSTGAWAAGGGQVGVASAGSQWAGGNTAQVVHTCTLTVTDSYGASVAMNKAITVKREPNTVPISTTTPHTAAGTATSYTIPHDFDPATNTVMVKLVGTLLGSGSADGDYDKVKHKWVCKIGATVTATATVELPFEVQLGGIKTGMKKHATGGIQTGASDPKYTLSGSAIQTSSGWGADQGHSGDGDLFMGTHTHDRNIVYVTLGVGTHACTLTTTDTYNEASSTTVSIAITAEQNTARL